MKDEHAAQQALKELTAAIRNRRDEADKRAEWYFRHAQQLDNERRAQGKRKTKRQGEYERQHAAAVSMFTILEELARKADELTEGANTDEHAGQTGAIDAEQAATLLEKLEHLKEANRETAGDGTQRARERIAAEAAATAYGNAINFITTAQIDTNPQRVTI